MQQLSETSLTMKTALEGGGDGFDALGEKAAAARGEVQLAYAIGVAHPVSVLVQTFGTGTVSDAVLSEAVQKVFDLRPSAIIRTLDLRRPIYRQLAAYGHMGREDLNVPWEKTDRADALLAAVNGIR